MVSPPENSRMYNTVANLDPHMHPSIGRMKEILHDAHALLTEKKCVTEEEVIDFAHDADAVITAQAPVNSNVIAKLKKCKVIGRLGSGTDNVDHEAATKHNIVVVYVPGFCTEEVANHALMFILACNKKLKRLDNYVRQGGWGFEQVAPIPAIKDQILGLIGFGRIARNLAKKAIYLGMKVRAFDPYISPEVFKENHISRRTLEEIMKESDYISLHIPLNKETEKIIGIEQLRMMKPTAYLINCARGAVVDEKALIDIIKQNAIAGAALDCLAFEPPQMDHPLFKLDNVIFTPHSAAYSDSAINYLREKTAQQVALVLNGRKPEFIRNPEVLKKVKLSDELIKSS